MSQKVKQVIYDLINEVVAEMSGDSSNVIFSAIEKRYKNPTEADIIKMFTGMGVPYKYAKGIAEKYLSSKSVDEDLEETTNQGSIAGYNVPGAFSGTASRGKKDARDARIAHGTVVKQIHDKVDKLREGKISVDESTKKYDIGMGYLGNGLTVWNRAEEEHGDYKTIAHVGETGVVKFYDKNLPPAIKRRIEKEGDLMKKKSKNESLNEGVVDYSVEYYKGNQALPAKYVKKYGSSGDALEDAINSAPRVATHVSIYTMTKKLGKYIVFNKKKIEESESLNEASGASDKKSFDMGARGYAKGLKAPSQDKSFMDYLKSTNNDATVGPFLKSWISGWTSAHIKDSNEILKKSGAFSPEELRAFPSMNEATYREFKGNPDLTTKQKIGLTIKEVNGALFKIERAIKQASKLKLERGVDPDNYWGSTRRQMNKISERILKIARELREMK